jgi:dihydrofolate synthase / folylpolyglutamate synthase
VFSNARRTKHQKERGATGVNYQEAITYIIDRSGYDRGFVANPFDAESVGLRRTEALLQMLDFPDTRYPTVHVAGSKGKGSTAAMIDSVLRTAGYRVGLYTTPHLHTFRERIQINGEPISESQFAKLTAELIPLNEALAQEHPDWGEATAFEVSTALAFLAFARAPVDVGVIEVGLGGRLDATNVIRPLVSVISSISLDHTSILGDTLSEIATEKGGIIKSGRPVISAIQQPEAATTLQQIADERGCSLTLGGRDWHSSGSTRNFSVTSPHGTLAEIRCGLAGQHQVQNAGLAVATIFELIERGFQIPEQSIRDGIASVTWPGRFEIASQNPLVIVDGAHNVDSCERLVEALTEEYPDHRISLVLGIARDKDVTGMIKTLAPTARTIIATASRSPRATDPETLVETVHSIDPAIDATSAPSVATALSRLMTQSDRENHVICVTGSLYAVGEAREALGLAETADFEQELLYR